MVEAKTQYGDLVGAIQIDCHNNVSDIYDLCTDNGFKIDKYFIIGFGFNDFTTSSVCQNGDLFCTVLMLEKSRYGNTFEEIEHKLSGEIKVFKKVFSVPYSNIGKYIKRVDALLFTKIGNIISSMKIEDLR